MAEQQQTQAEGRASEGRTADGGASAQRARRKIRTGVVTSDKMAKTVTVSLTRRYAHPVYGKQVTRTKKVKARNVEGEGAARAGDTVRIMETRPLAKTVRWRVTDVVERAK
jgi:small subunit ribosomal protein S17